MFRGIVVAGAMLLASAPAGAVVVYQSSGVLPAGERVWLSFWGQPTLGRPYPLDALDGHYRATFVSEEIASLDLESCFGCQFYMGAELREYVTELQNWEVTQNYDNPFLIRAEYKPFSSVQEFSFDYRYFIDSVDENGNGEWTTYDGIFNLDFQMPVLEKPISYTYTVERFTLPPVPEPATWAMMIGGLGMAGAAMRRRRAAIVPI